MRPTLCLLIALVLAAVGCGGGPKRVPVQGRVVLADGRPVTAASICFTPLGTADNPGVLATSLLAEDGTFTLRTYPDGDGALVGSYKVTIALGLAARGNLAKYTRLKDTPLLVDVPPEGIKDLVFTLE